MKTANPSNPGPKRKAAGGLLAVALALGLVYGYFSVRKAALGIDFTDEGLYVATPLRLSLGEAPFSSEIMTLLRPGELISQVLFYLFKAPTLYQLRLSGWSLHIFAYLVFFWVLYREGRSWLIASLASAISFFVSFGWPSAIATPSYKSLSADGLLLYLCLFYASQRRPSPSAPFLRLFAGLSLLVAAICYPSMIVLLALMLAHDLWQWRRATNASIREKISRAAASIAALSAGFLFFSYLGLSGAAGRWLARISLVRNSTLSAFKGGGLFFYRRLFFELFTKVPAFVHYTGCALLLAGFILAASRRARRQWLPGLLLLFLGYSLYVFAIQFHGDGGQNSFFLPTAYCLLSVVFILIDFLLELRGESPLNPAELYCIFFSLAACLVYATSTYFFDYYYSWNNGLLGLPFAFSFILSRQLAEHCRGRKIVTTLAAVALLACASIAFRYNYYGIRRDADAGELTARFTIPPLRGIKSSQERVAAIEALYQYLKPRMADGQPLLAFDDCPMLYFIFKARPAYGMAWAVRYTVSAATLEELDREFRAGPLPQYALRALVDVSAPSWKGAPAVNYDNYPLNRTVLRRYDLEKTIYPFEIFRLRQAAP